MNAPLTLVGAFAFGLLASGHCLVMCGGIAGALGTMTARGKNGGARWDLLAGYQLGRIASYSLAGLALGGIGAGLVQFLDQDHVRTALRWLSALVFAALAFNLLRRGRGLDTAIGRGVWAKLAPLARRFLPVRGLPQAFALGALWGWMPCGLVYSVLFVAALGVDPLYSAAIMLMFGLGTVPAVLIGALGAGKAAQFLGRKGLRSGIAAMLLGFAVLTAGGPWLVAHGMAAHLPWLPADCLSR
jgi:sulfite exporter TauE/SafE